MEKGSFSLSTLRFLELVVVELGLRCQKLFFSGGEGYKRYLSATVIHQWDAHGPYRKVDTAIIHNCQDLVSTQLRYGGPGARKVIRHRTYRSTYTHLARLYCS